MAHCSDDTRSDGRSWLVPGAVIVASLVLLARFGWIGPDIDVWYGAGLVRALGERPLLPESLGHVPKIGHLLLLVPAALFDGQPERWLLIVGVGSLGAFLATHARWAASARISGPRLVVVLAAMPIVWRATLDGGSVPWAWMCVLLSLRHLEARRPGAALWLGAGTLFRPEVLGVAVALAVLTWRHSRRQSIVQLLLPGITAIGGTLLVDLLWTGRAGGSSIAHAVFESASLEQIRGRWGFLDTAHPLLHLSIVVAVMAGGAVLAQSRAPESRSPTRPLLLLTAAAAGFSAVTIANVAAGGTLFVRFLLPWTSVLAGVVAATRWPRRQGRATLAATVLVVASALMGLPAYREFVGTWPSASAMLVARGVAQRTDGRLIVAMDAGVRAVSLGSGVRPWKTSPWILQAPGTMCESQVLLARGAFLRRLDSAQLVRCGPWEEVLVDSAQVAADVHLLLARRERR